MDAPELLEKITAKLEKMPQAKLAAILQYVDSMESSETLPDDYDPDNDPAIGFFSGHPDLGSNTSDILRNEFGLRKSDKNES